MIWVSEIILQQTRVAQGTPYFLRFMEAFPDIRSLAGAREEDVLKLWEGLGYYSRARNMLFTAKTICEEHGGKFPDSYEDILRLKGIGPYTAAAIASFAYGLKHAVVDGNVIRVISRVVGLRGTPDKPVLGKNVASYVQEAIKHAAPEEFNQAIMDLGATVCLPSGPLCTQCPMHTGCYASINRMTAELPEKKLRLIKKKRFFHFYDLAIAGGQSVLHKREAGDIWRGLFQFPLIETTGPDVPAKETVSELLLGIFQDNSFEADAPDFVFKMSHIITHQAIEARFYKINIARANPKINNPYYLVESKKVGNFAFPKIFKDYFLSQHKETN